MEGDHHHSSSSSGKKNPERQVASNRSILSTITGMFDFSKASQTRNVLMSAIVMMIIFYRVARRQPAAKASSGTGPRRNATARDAARNKLVGRANNGSGTAEGVLGFNWIMVIYRKIIDTIKM